MNIFNGDEDLQRRYADALKTSVDKTFGVDMNNKPAAWMATIGEDTVVTDDSEFVLKMWQHNGYAIQELYTHPVKELTDEEILELSEQHLDMGWQTGVIEFAKAILRKAQEK